MVALGLIPTLHAILTLLPLALASTERFGWTVVWLTPVILYLLPVVVVRAFLAVRPLTLGQLATDDPGFLAWWFSAQWQVVFVRLPFLEELLRLVLVQIHRKEISCGPAGKAAYSGGIRR